MPPDDLVSADDLSALLAGAAEPPILLDVRWTLAGADRDGYRAGHIPGAVFVDLDRDLAGPPGPGGRHPLPEATALQEVWRSAGIAQDSAVVAYDAQDASSAARAWWLLRWSGVRHAAVLNGGFGAWTANPARRVETRDRQARRRGTAVVRPGGMPTVDLEGAAALGREGVLLDARAADRYRGEVEPVDPVAGHIPGAVNVPYTDLLNPDGTLRTSAELQAALAAAGTRAGGPGLVTGQAASCGSGVTACHLILAGAVVGVPLALFPGSYSQWCAAGRAVAVGD